MEKHPGHVQLIKGKKVVNLHIDWAWLRLVLIGHYRLIGDQVKWLIRID